MLYSWLPILLLPAQLETLALVMADVFGRTLLVTQRALILLVVLLAIAAINIGFSALDHKTLVSVMQDAIDTTMTAQHGASNQLLFKVILVANHCVID